MNRGIHGMIKEVGKVPEFIGWQRRKAGGKVKL
jgi:hypothetical protein